MMGIAICVILLFSGVAVLIVINVCILKRAFWKGFAHDHNLMTSSSSSSTQIDIETMMIMSRHQELKNLPCFDYKESAKKEEGTGLVDCVICLENFKVGDNCRLLPNCNHTFHVQCVDLWLLKTSICPICRSSVDPPKNCMTSIK